MNLWKKILEGLLITNLFVTSKFEFSNSPITEFKVLYKSQRAFKNSFLMVHYYFKKHFKPCFLILKTFCSTLISRIGEFVFWCHEQVIYFLNSNRKAVKATVILLPLFGLHWLLTLYRPSSGNCILLSIYKYLNITLDGLQGLMVAIAFCYRNAEVSHP